MNGPDRRRRTFLRGSAAGLLTMLLAGCDRLNASRRFRKLLQSSEAWTRAVQKTIVPRKAMAQEFSEAQISPDFRSNGTSRPRSPAYQALAEHGFRDWQLQVGGLVERPIAFSLQELKSLPARTQITRHDCVEGWSAIGQWTGVPFHAVLSKVKPTRAAKYVVFHCADQMDADDASYYYESIDMDDAYHPQTMLAYELNGQPLPVKNGAPLRLRVERQLGYKHAKYLMRIELVSSLDTIRGGKGGYWEDGYDYAWYAGI